MLQIQFYCEERRKEGLETLLKAASQQNADAMHALAIIHFNGSGGQRKDKDLTKAAALCEAAGALGHTNALRELGHCLQDGYGVERDIGRGRHLIQQANLQEVNERNRRLLSKQDSFNSLSKGKGATATTESEILSTKTGSTFGGRTDTWDTLVEDEIGLCKVISPGYDQAHSFLGDWFEKSPSPPAFRMCSHEGCGRPETRRHEFRRCSACGKVHFKRVMLAFVSVLKTKATNAIAGQLLLQSLSSIRLEAPPQV
mgnify:CR=1 FL=1